MKPAFPLMAFGLMAIFSSCNNQPSTKQESTARPNVLIILADDMGFSDIGCYGGNISTPVIDGLAKEGMKFSNFHVLPTCSPTRSALLTGNDNHVAGLGIMGELDYPALHELNLPGYAAELSQQVATIPELLAGNGYHTYMTGKWHLGEGPGKDPHDRGFEESFILGTGGGSHFNDRKALAPPQHMEYTRNGVVVEPPQDFYSTRNYTDSMIRFINMHKEDGKPFFGYLSYTAVHDPLHAPKEYIDKYKGKFDMGWDSLWTMRLSNLKALGLVDQGINKFVKNPSIPTWKSLSKKEQQDYARDMEVYAAMLEYMDMSIGRVIDYLKKEGLYENTMILFLSDNGPNGAMATAYPGNEDHKYLDSFNNQLDNRGLKGSYIEMGPGWAQASAAPYRLFKGFVGEGGIKAPLLVKMPGQAKSNGQWNHGMLHVTDIMPTILELTGTTYPAEYRGRKIHQLIGKSMLPVLKGDSATIHSSDGMGWELFEMKAYIRGNWKLMRLPKPFGSGQWELYDLSKDPGETTDLSIQFPTVKQELIEAWGKYAKENEVFDHKGHFDSLYRKSYGLDDE
ncbi:arylsulfatase [Flavihumibacter rivuli]|uniref:arylsulfatase n=1 Tax=Flavihumibacter rivuli TaxID=2838156 RepID=UPI001BDEA6C2|nr:arylsulfatase [Flavihumibacter rivuli]ULQ55798.1 arylsulfatase [Flavihumibacter rivuli]